MGYNTKSLLKDGKLFHINEIIIYSMSSIIYNMSNAKGSYTDDDLIPTTRVLKGRKQALADAYSRRLKAKHTLYCITTL